MSSNRMKSPRQEDLTSAEDDTLGSSISLSVGENSIRIKEKAKPLRKEDSVKEEQDPKEKWWLKKTDSCLEIPKYSLPEAKMKLSPSPSPDVSSSMKEFLEKEKMCKAMHRSELEVKEKDDTLCDILASSAFDKYPSDFENATDEDIGSILEEMSKIAGALSPNSGADRTKSRSSSKHQIEEERSVEELLEEAQKLVRKNSTSLSKSASKSDTLVPDEISDDKETASRVRQLEADIFQMIEEEVHKETEKIRKSPKSEKAKRDGSPSFEVVYENFNNLKPPKTLEFQRRKFEEQKVEVSSSSDLDDPIERHSRSEDLKSVKKDSNKDNLQKEITDVDKDFFEDLLRRSKEKAEGGGMSGSSSFGQEDFSHFLKLLQGQTDKKDQEQMDSNPVYNFLSKAVDGKGNPTSQDTLMNDKSPQYPEKEISEILEKELPRNRVAKTEHEIDETDDSTSKDNHPRGENSDKISTVVSKSNSKESFKKMEVKKKEQQSPKHPDALNQDKKDNDADNQLYPIGLTPRLELFADTIPKLIAEKSNEITSERSKEISEQTKPIQQRKSSISAPIKTAPSMSRSHSSNVESASFNTRKSVLDLHKLSYANNPAENKQKKRELKFCKSKSYDQICKPPLRSSLENVRVKGPFDPMKKSNGVQSRRSPILKPKIQPKSEAKPAPKPKESPKPKRDSFKPPFLLSSSSTSKLLTVKSPETHRRHYMAGGDSKYNVTKQNWEILCREERHRSALLKQQLESEAKSYKHQIENMRVSFEREVFALRKENIILKARVDELSLSEKRHEIQPKKDTKIVLMEKELEKQENLIRAYETENKKLMQETKRMQEEMKSLQKQKSTAFESNKTQQLADRIKDLEEETLKLNLEIKDLKLKNSDAGLKNEDLQQQNSLLMDELEMFREQLRTKNDFITDRLHAMTTHELQLKKQAEELSVKLSSKTEQLKMIKCQFEKLQQSVLPLEKELLESRVKEGHLQEKLQVAKSHVEREKQLTQKLKDQVIIDNKKIMDLNRQVREMERILKRKNPDSVSALILTANSEHERISFEKVKLLEDRISTLEREIKVKDEEEQAKLIEFQRKFSEMKEKYVSQIAELEAKIAETTAKERKLYNDMFSQTVAVHVENKSVETIKNEERAGSFEKDEKKDQKNSKPMLKSQNSKEDAHLIATIRGLKLELTNKDKTVSKLTREYQELQKTNRRLQKEREKLLSDRKSVKISEFEKSNRIMVSSDSKLLSLRSSEANDQNSNIYQNGHASEQTTHRLSSSMQRLYDPLHYTENSDNITVKRLTNENEILREELSKMNKDFMALKNKRLHDLNLLQEEHEREMATLLKEYSVKFGESKVVKLQGQINTHLATISQLKQQIDKLRDFKEQVVVLKAERDHLENKVKTLSDKVHYLSTPSTEQLQLLQDKITLLQQRHESREMTLQTLVRDLIRSRTQCKDCRNEKGKNQKLCYFRQELDHILGMLQEIANIH